MPSTVISLLAVLLFASIMGGRSAPSHLCSASDDLLGEWQVNVSYNRESKSYVPVDKPTKELPFIGCKKTYEYVANHWVATVRHQVDYGKCAVMPSVFVPRNCKLLEIGESAKALRQYFNRVNGNRLPLKVQVIGDSLGQQLEIGARCIVEIESRGEDVVMVHNRDQYLRSDYPCAAECTNKTHAEITTNFDCHACRDGEPRTYSLESSWLRYVNNDTNIVVLNTGAWYNGYLLRDKQYEAQYDRTIKISMEVAAVLTERNISVIWTPLPPVKYPGKKFAWDQFIPRNKRTRDMLVGSAIHYIDFNPQIIRLRDVNPSIDYKGQFHFCNPSPSAVLTFMFKVTLSLLHSALT